MILGGPESEPFAKLDSAIKETRNFPVFMVPDEEYPNAVISDFPSLFSELSSKLGTIKRIGLVVAAGRLCGRPGISSAVHDRTGNSRRLARLHGGGGHAR
jgi:hypothetical protein